MEKRALISVSDKTGIVEFAKELTTHYGYTILSTGGTAKLLAEKGIPVTEVSDYTGFPEMMDGRVKTLHPKIHGGLLSLRSNEAHMAQAKEHGIGMIDLVVVNLYPFEATVAKPNCTLEDAIENIDIGGPSMLRSAAKNHASVTVVCDSGDYPSVLDAMRQGGEVLQQLRKKLALKVYQRTSAYDAAISTYLNAKYNGEGSLPETLNIGMPMVQKMRYGENPHQNAALYGDFGKYFKQLHGKELSYNNIADSDAAWEACRQFQEPACVIVKHANPCGVAIGADSAEAYKKAFKTDPTSAFGGILAFNTPVTEACAEEIAKQFAEVIMAPAFEDGALAILQKKPSLRLLVIETGDVYNDYEFKRVGGGMLIQTPDLKTAGLEQLRVVTKKQPTAKELEDLLFAWKVAKFVKSNTIVFAKDGMTMGVGAGQMSRLDSARIASIKAEKAGLSLSGTAVASDAFFPFRDGLDVVADAGATCVIQPGGSVRDEEVIAAADERGIVMVFTGGERHFRH